LLDSKVTGLTSVLGGQSTATPQFTANYALGTRLGDSRTDCHWTVSEKALVRGAIMMKNSPSVSTQFAWFSWYLQTSRCPLNTVLKRGQGAPRSAEEMRAESDFTFSTSALTSLCSSAF